jgi:hypothetical protein
LIKGTPRETLVPVEIQGFSTEDVVVLTLEVVLEE